MLDAKFLVGCYSKPRNKPKFLWNKIKKEEDKSWGFLNFSSSAVNYNFIKDIRKKSSPSKGGYQGLRIPGAFKDKRIKEE